MLCASTAVAGAKKLVLNLANYAYTSLTGKDTDENSSEKSAAELHQTLRTTEALSRVPMTQKAALKCKRLCTHRA